MRLNGALGEEGGGEIRAGKLCLFSMAHPGWFLMLEFIKRGVPSLDHHPHHKPALRAVEYRGGVLGRPMRKCCTTSAVMATAANRRWESGWDGEMRQSRGDGRVAVESPELAAHRRAAPRRAARVARYDYRSARMSGSIAEGDVVGA